MDSVNLCSLLLAEEGRVRTELQADSAIDQNRRQSVERLNGVLDGILLRYNAANADDPNRQALADCQAASVRDMLGLLLAGTAEKEIIKRRLRSGAVICLLLAVICALVCALVIREYYAVGCVMIAASALFGFLSGRLWYGEREVRVHAQLDADVVWKTLKKSVESMDRKAEEYLAQQELRSRETGAGIPHADASLSADTLKLVGDLLEALYAENGEYAVRQLRKLLPWLHQQGIETVDYSPDTRELFELLPTKRSSATQRPALVRGETLLLAGRATEHVD